MIRLSQGVTRCNGEARRFSLRKRRLITFGSRPVRLKRCVSKTVGRTFASMAVTSVITSTISKAGRRAQGIIQAWGNHDQHQNALRVFVRLRPCRTTECACGKTRYRKIRHRGSSRQSLSRTPNRGRTCPAYNPAF